MTSISMDERISKAEFIALMAMMFATIAFAIDAMLPALPAIGAELSSTEMNRVQLVLTSFLLGMGLGTFITGPLSDAYGRKPVLLSGLAVYMAGSMLAWSAESLETLLAARVLQGLGAAGPKVVTLAIVRDLYSGRAMAQLMSFVMIVFTLVPVLAPAIGAAIIYYAGWRGVCGSFIFFALIAAFWLGLRQPETLPLDRRRPLKLKLLLDAVNEVIRHRVVRTTIAVQSLALGVHWGMLSSAQQIFDITYDQGNSFPYWFGALAIVAGSASLLNAHLVVRLGMRYLVQMALVVQFFLSGLVVLTLTIDILPVSIAFPVFLFWMTSIFFMAGLVLGNLNAIAMKPMGHIAGAAASVIGAITTIQGVAFAALLGQAFDASPLPLAVGILICLALCIGLLRFIPQE